jgi:hypothetical protein
MKKGDIVQLVTVPDSGWRKEHLGRIFEVHEVYERRCLVRMLNISNQERYWFIEKVNFQPANLQIIEIEEHES